MIITEDHQAPHYHIGPKAQGLFRLKKWGYVVPDFFCLPWEVLKDIQFQNDTLANLPDALSDQINDWLSNWHWKEEGLAVRSSFGAEDGAVHSFAGIFETFLNVKTENDLHQAIADVVQSAHSQRVSAYLKDNEIEGNLFPAVIIQKQIFPDFSGVIFSKNPRYPEEIAIHMVEGLGDQLVSGQLSPAEYYLNRASAGIAHQEIPDGLEGMADAISNGSLLKQLFDTAMDLEQKSGYTADIEFCIKGDQLYILQIRPVTIPIPEVILFDNSNIQESYCGVTTPLTFSFVQRAYATVYKQTMKVLGLSGTVIRNNEEVVNNLLGLVNGRIYYNIQNWYKGLLLLPSFKQNKEDMERMMGLETPVDFIDPQPKSFFEKIKMAPGLIKNLLRLLKAFRKLDTSIQQFHKEFEAYYSGFYKKDLDAYDLRELWELKNELDEKLLQNWTTPIINDFYVMMKSGTALRSIQGPEAELKLKQQTLGQSDLASIRPVIAMKSLADELENDKELKAFVENMPAAQLVEKIRSDYPEFQKKVDQYIYHYGDRTVGELKLETQTMRVQPLAFFNYLKNLVGSDRPVEITSGAKGEVNSKVRKLKKAIRNREALRLERTKLFGMYRSLYLTIGKKLYWQNMLDQSRDIFFLSESEIKSMIDQPGRVDDLIEKRKKDNEAWEKITVPPRVIMPSRALNQTYEVEITDQLKGQSCHAGAVAGAAIVIKDPGDDLNVKGKIVCALRTDPGWATLFPSCKAVLIEKGSTLSHSAIILQEMGIPSIINIPGLTEQVNSGDHLEVNAHTGHIQILRNG